MSSENNQITPETEGFNAAFEPILQDAPTQSDGDAVVYPRNRRARARALREAALNALPEVADAVAGPSLPDAAAASTVMDEELDNEICKKYSLRGATLGDIYSGRLGGVTLGLNLPRTLEEALEQEECISLPLYATGPASANPADFAAWEIEQEQNRKLASLTAKYQAEQDAAYAACYAQHPEYQKVVKGADCEEPMKFKAYNPFIKYVESREAEGAAASAAIEAQLNPYGGYLGEDGEPDVSYGPYQEIAPYISPGENPHEYISQVYADAAITDAEMSQIAQMLADRPQLRAVGDTTPGDRDPIIAGAGFGATLCMSYVSCDAYTVTCSGMCASDPCIWFENYCGGPIIRHPADIAYMEPGGTGGGWGTRNIGDLFLARFDQCYYWCVQRREGENPSLENPLTEAEIRALCEPERCLPAYCLDHHLAGPNMDYLETPADPRDALVGRTDADICKVAYLLANGWGIDDNDNQWWTIWSGNVLPSNGYMPYPTPTPTPPVDSCDGRYGNWHGKPCAFARIVTQMAIWAVQISAPRTPATGGIFIICDTHNPNNYTPATAPFRESLDRAFANLVNSANAYAAESDCVDRLNEDAGSVFTGPSEYTQYPNGDIERGISAVTPYPPRSLRDLNLPVISNCNADAQSITACATDTRSLFWTAIPNEVRIVCGRVLVGPFRLHSTKGSVSAPRWEVRNTCGCNPDFPEYDETSPRCQSGGDWYHTSHCSNLFSFVDYCGNPICCDAGSFESGGRLPDEPCLDTDFYIAVKITGRYMCFTLCVEASYRQVVVMMWPNTKQAMGARCPNADITPEVACICVCVETPQEEPAPDLFPPAAVFPPPPSPVYRSIPQQTMPQPFLVAPPPPPRPPKPPEFPPPIVIPPPPPPPPMPPRVVQPVIIPPPPPPLPPDHMPPCPPIIVTPPPECPTLPEIPPPAPVIVRPPVDIRKPVLLPPMPPMPPSMKGARPARLPIAPPPNANQPPWPQRPMPPINGAPPPMPGYESSPMPGMPPPWPVTPPPRAARPRLREGD